VKPNALLIDSRDDVVTVLQAVRIAEPVSWANGGPILAQEEIPVGHKVAIRPIATGSVIRKYGWPIGVAGMEIIPGERVHTRNLCPVEE
jgi:altronate hydrolase